MFNKSKFNGSPNPLKRANMNQVKAVKVGTKTPTIKLPKGTATKGKVIPAQNGVTATKKSLVKAPPSKKKKAFNVGNYFDQSAGPFGGFRGITSTGKKPYQDTLLTDALMKAL